MASNMAALIAIWAGDKNGVTMAGFVLWLIIIIEQSSAWCVDKAILLLFMLEIFIYYTIHVFNDCQLFGFWIMFFAGVILKN